VTKPDFSAVRALILDLDGVLWRSTEAIGELPAVFAKIDQLGLKVILATNNATLSVQQYLEKLGSFGVTLRPEQIINSGHAAAYYLSRHYPSGGTVYVIGENGLRQALAEKGFIPGEADPLAVIVGMDRQLSYDKLSRATLLIRSGLPFIGTNPDSTFPTPYGLIPGVGAILAALETATGTPPVIVGKPQPDMYRFALEGLGVSPEQTLVVGDRVETDILGAQKLGCKTALVLSGVTSQAAAKAWMPPPDWIGPDLTSLLVRLDEGIGWTRRY
jgi:4-nitrophenyl phosphatase